MPHSRTPRKGDCFTVNVNYGVSSIGGGPGMPLTHLVEIIGHDPIHIEGRTTPSMRPANFWTVYDADDDCTRLVHEGAFPTWAEPSSEPKKDAYEGYCAKCDEISLFYDEDYVCAWCRDTLEGWRP